MTAPLAELADALGPDATLVTDPALLASYRQDQTLAVAGGEPLAALVAGRTASTQISAEMDEVAATRMAKRPRTIVVPVALCPSFRQWPICVK